MKKIYWRMAAMAIAFTTSCSNEAQMENNASIEREFSLEVNVGEGSRTIMDAVKGNIWDENDAVYVFSSDKTVYGVLTIASISSDGKTAVFRGRVNGDKPLTHVVYPAPSGPVVAPDQLEIRTNHVNGTEYDAPMYGTIAGNSSNFEYAGGLLKIQISGLSENHKAEVTAKVNGRPVTGGHYSIAGNGELVYNEDGNTTFIEEFSDEGIVYLPVAAGADAEEAVIEAEIYNNLEENSKRIENISVNVQKGQITDNGELNKNLNELPVYITVDSREELLAAITNNVINIQLGGNISMLNRPLIVTGELNLNLNGYELTGGTFAESEGVVTEGTTDSYAIWAKGDNANVTISGEGAVSALDAKYSMAVWAQDGAIVKINDGYFKNGGDGTDCIYASNGSTINIYGGHFMAAENTFDEPGTKNPYSVLNKKGVKVGVAASYITVYGGEFFCFNPAKNVSENPEEDFVADGYQVVNAKTGEVVATKYEKDNGPIWYRVVKVEPVEEEN